MARRPRLKGGKPVADRLIDAAEALIGQFGTAGVSLRQIGSAAGTVNNYAVQYHFGDMDDLIHAIFEKRMPMINDRVRARLAVLQVDDALSDTRSLVESLMRPLLDIFDEDGERSFARFLSALLRSVDGSRHFDNIYALIQPVWQVIDHLGAANPHVPRALMIERLRLASIMVFSSAFNRREPFDDMALFDAYMVDDVIGMGAATISAPVQRKLSAVLQSGQPPSP